MTLGPIIPFLAIVLITSVTGMVHGAGRNDPEFTRLAAIGFIALLCSVALLINSSVWRGEKKTETATATVHRNGHLATLVYVWGASAMFAVYSLSDLSWRHAWQYGLGMVVIGLGILIYVLRVEDKSFPPIWLTIFHGLAACAGLAYLLGTEKMQTVKSDWAANEVFLWGGIGIVFLCVLSLITQLLDRHRAQ